MPRCASSPERIEQAKRDWKERCFPRFPAMRWCSRRCRN